MNEEKPHICQLIDRQLRELRIPPKALAADLGVSVSAVSRWRKDIVPESAKLPAICAFLQIDPQELLSLSQPEEGFLPAVSARHAEVPDDVDFALSRGNAKGKNMGRTVMDVYEERLQDMRLALERADRRNERLEDKLERMEERLDKQSVRIDSLQAENKELVSQIAAIKTENAALRSVLPDSLLPLKVSGE
ncbi:helix-turn-helix transcriptional regulator [Desulfobotulus sp. H1]|uniref:Helix-turn-helix transcriptional regulator n=1 Tax=Desulfobotulus pelophilus TaxID=2823377 RepID=A0ABT3NDD0_9BACT|nr:helix-turn-helix transcriptional regulator [Desulfobotulus pelophilus]MCW7755463.1 helix-turn-helix transcriptional regulator [Desulfobotulus pelophilus]